jgi:NTE family protein
MLFPISLFASDNQIDISPDLPERARIGLVLSGGGACGMAHIGILKAIEKYNIPVDYITGTSMGAIVGILYSCGYSASEIEMIVEEIEWDALLYDKIERKYISHRDREIYEKSILRLEVENRKIKLPEGLTYGQNAFRMLSKLTWSQRNVRDFSQLPIPFKCIATDIQTGEAVVLDKGNIADAVRASMAIPSIFSAIEIDGKLLVDGGFTRNLPVSDVKAMGADIVIAVDAGTPLYKKEELNNFTKVIDQVTRLVVSNTAKEERILADKVIIPDLKNFNTFNFDESSEIIKAGEAAAALEESYFAELSLQLNSGTDFPKKNDSEHSPAWNAMKYESIVVDKIIIEGNQKILDSKIINLLGIREGEILTAEKLNSSIGRLYGTMDFYLIRYSVLTIEGENILYIMTEESADQELFISTNYNTNDNASLYLGTAYKDFLIDDSRLDLKGKFGENFQYNFKYYIPVSWLGNIETGIRMGYSRRDFFLYNDKGEKESKIYSDLFDSSFFVEKTIFNSMFVGTAAEKDYITYKDDISVYDIDGSLDYNKIRLYLLLDILDSSVYPTRGLRFWSSAERIFIADSFTSGFILQNSGIENYNQIKADADFYFPLFPFMTLNSSIVYCGTDNPDYNKGIGFLVGGSKSRIENEFIGFEGLMPGDVIADNLVKAKTGVNFRFLEHFVFTPFYVKLYYNFDENGSKGEVINSYGGTLALVNTFFGPIEISLSKADKRKYPVFYFNFGFNF